MTLYLLRVLLIGIFFVVDVHSFAAAAATSRTSTTADDDSSTRSSSSTTTKNSVSYYPETFTKSETQKIINQFKDLLEQVDHREDKAVRRTNYFDDGTKVTTTTEDKNSITSPNSPYMWIFERIYQTAFSTEDTSNIQNFQNNIEFVLLHEFDKNGMFDWHVDCLPNDKTSSQRTLNINVMLTDRSAYQGGELIVDSFSMSPNNGDLYTYPASHPHKVVEITKGQRHTLVVAMKRPPKPKQQQQGIENNNNVEDDEYWIEAEQNYKSLCDDNDNTRGEPKLHMLYGNFLQALGTRSSYEIDSAFASSYACTDQATEYAEHFLKQGQQLKAANQPEATYEGFFTMAQMIQERINKV